MNKLPIPKEYFEVIKKNKIRILDIIYKPKNTPLYKVCKKYKIQHSNGIEMNSLQAEIALKLIHNYLKNEK